MPTVRFLALGLEVDANIGDSILECARAVGAPEGSHCGGVCACSTCHVYVRGDIVSEMSVEERDMLELAAKEARPTSRLGCQAKLVAEGTCDVTISEESFRTYLDDHPADRDRALTLWRKRTA